MPRVFIAELDLFSNVGGGQTVYQSIIARKPSTHFVYLIKDEPKTASRPANVTAVPFVEHYQPNLSSGSRLTSALYAPFLDAMNMARSVAEAIPNAYFDAIDSPDYRLWGPFLRHGFEHHGLSVGFTMLALFGTISSALRSNWPGGLESVSTLAQVRAMEHLQFRIADKRTTVCEPYGVDWRQYSLCPVYNLDPLALTDLPSPAVAEPGDGPPDIYFLGRREKRKGPDLFIDLLWWLERGSYRDAYLIGPDSRNSAGVGSTGFLEQAARFRNVDVKVLGGLPIAALNRIYEKRAVIVLPSRYDQLNLMALDALLRGCPVAVSLNAGVTDYLRWRHPAVPFVPLSLSSSRLDVAKLQELLGNYDTERARLVEAVAGVASEIDHRSLETLYDPTYEADKSAAVTVRNLFFRYLLFDKLKAKTHSPVRSAAKATARAISAKLSPEAYAAMRDAALAVRYRRLQPGQRQFVRNKIAKATGIDAKSWAELFMLREADYHRGNVGHHLPERTDKEIRSKIRQISDIVGTRLVDRIPLYYDLARLELRRGNDIVSATYSLRLMRWLGRDHFGQIESVADILRGAGFSAEAETACAMYGPVAERSVLDASLEILCSALAHHRTMPPANFEFVDDRRGTGAARVSVIVSLYRAESKLASFLDMLRQQTLLTAGEVEVILVDSGSPQGEYATYQRFVEKLEFQSVYARTPTRETIQAAWNRGVSLAKAPYLAFLGVDEGLRPDCLRILSSELDQNSNIDWVMADSIVTNVDKTGVFDADVMKYDRTGYRQDWHYLDCTFLSYVGGLYRRNLHERFGYYDESFRAAGDSEFKNRILPFIASKYIPLPLGVFNNYPDGRTTESSTAEIEDLRAWYLHRSAAGVRYALEKAGDERVEKLFRDTLRYRKCYCAHWSTDIEFGYQLARLLEERGRLEFNEMAEDLNSILRLYRDLEMLDILETPIDKRLIRMNMFRKVRQEVTRIAHKHGVLLGGTIEPAYEIFNDNRYEQHWWPWRT